MFYYFECNLIAYFQFKIDLLMNDLSIPSSHFTTITILSCISFSFLKKKVLNETDDANDNKMKINLVALH